MNLKDVINKELFLFANFQRYERMRELEVDEAVEHRVENEKRGK